MRVRRYTYPDDWKDISRQVREAAGWKCQKCGAPHGALICRRLDDPSQWVMYVEGKFGKAEELIYSGIVKVKLSVHHIGVDKPDGSPGDSMDKSDCRPENLIALCQRYHLVADKEVSHKHARETKRNNKRQRILAAGQIELFNE